MDHFQSITWCAELLNRPNTIPYTLPSRIEDDGNGNSESQDLFFRQNLKKDDLIPHALGLYQDPFANLKSTDPLDLDFGPGARFLVPSSTTLFDLGTGLQGFKGSVHGAVTFTIAGEAMGSLVFINKVAYIEALAAGKVSLMEGIVKMDEVEWLGGEFNVQYMKPMPIPQVVLVTSTVRKIKGRKAFIEVEVKNKEGVKYATCEGIWISVAKAKPRSKL